MSTQLLPSYENYFIGVWNIHFTISVAFCFTLSLSLSYLQIQDDCMPRPGSMEQSDRYEDVSFPAEGSTIEMSNQSNAVSNQEVQYPQ